MGGLFGGGKTASNSPAALGTLQVQTSAYGYPIPIVYGKTRIAVNLLAYYDFLAISHTSSQSSGGKGGSRPPANVTYTYQCAPLMGLCEGPINAIGTVWASKVITTASALGLTVFLGTYPQSPWGYLTTNHPTQAIGYQGIAYLAGGAYQLGSGNSLPNHTVEVDSAFGFNSTIRDCDASVVVQDFLSNVHYGAAPGFPLGSLTQYSAYCVANGLFISPAFTEQKPGHEWLKMLAKITNTALVFSEGVMKFIPYGDSTVTGNGVTYTPVLTVQYDLTDDDFQPGNNDPITVKRKTQADAFNNIKVEFLNRANAYNIEIAEATDQANIELFGLRPDQPRQMHAICDAGIAKFVAQMLLQRALYIRNTYEFTLGWNYCLLEPMDIVTLTDTGLGLSKFQVRLTAIEEDSDGLLHVTAEEYPFGVASPALYTYQTGSGYNVNYNTPAPVSGTPVIFEAPVDLATNSLEVWLGQYGATGWGGCDVWVSGDNVTYQRVGTIYGSARIGTLTTGVNAGSDPDTTNTLAVDLTASGGQLLSGTQADADALHTLCWLDGELVSYETATLTATGKYSLTYLRRAAYNTIGSSHASGAQFMRLDNAVFKYGYASNQIGKTLYFKFPSFNTYGGGAQDLGSAVAYTHTLIGPPPPPNVTGFAVRQSGGAVVFTWTRVPQFDLKGYDIRYAAQTVTDWTLMTPLTEAAMSTEMTNASVPPGAWVFAIRARDIVDQLSTTMATTTLTVTNENATVDQRQECPGLDGTVSSFLAHWTGVLVPLGTYPASHYVNWQDFGVVYLGSTPFVPDPIATATYTQNTRDTQYNDALRVWPIITATPGPGVTGTPVTAFSLDYWLSGAADPAIYNAWTTGSAQLRYYRGRVTATPGVVPSVINIFTVTADKSNKTQLDGANLAVAAGGTAVTFTTQFHSPPFVTAIYTGTSALFATATSITATGCVIHIFNTSGTDVGGSSNWTASGF